MNKYRSIINASANFPYRLGFVTQIRHVTEKLSLLANLHRESIIVRKSPIEIHDHGAIHIELEQILSSRLIESTKIKLIHAPWKTWCEEGYTMLASYDMMHRHYGNGSNNTVPVFCFCYSYTKNGLGDTMSSLVICYRSREQATGNTFLAARSYLKVLSKWKLSLHRFIFTCPKK